MTTYKEIGLSEKVAALLIEASTHEGFEQLATPEGCRSFVNAGGDLSDAVKGIGEKTEELILGLLAAMPDPLPDPVVSESIPDVSESIPDVDVEPAIASRTITVTIQVPVAPIADGYEANQAAGGRLQMGRLAQKTQVQLAPAEAVAFLQIREGLLQNDMRLPNGEPVKNNADVIRWWVSKVIEAGAV